MTAHDRFPEQTDSTGNEAVRDDVTALAAVGIAIIVSVFLLTKLLSVLQGRGTLSRKGLDTAAMVGGLITALVLAVSWWVFHA